MSGLVDGLPIALGSADLPRTAVVLGAVGVAAAVGSAHRRRLTVRIRCRGLRTTEATEATEAGEATDPAAAADRSRPARPPTPSRHPARRGIARSWRLVETSVGGAVRRAAGRPGHADRDRRVGRSLLVAGSALLGGAGPAVAAAVGLATWVLPLVAATRRRARRRRAISDETPEVVELVRLGVGSGLNVRLALDAVTRHHDGVIAGELARVLGRVERGERLADALDSMVLDGDSVQPLVDALVATERYGAPLVDALDRVAADARTASRRRAEEAARRVPVKLLFPLVFCTLPAFVLLTVVPVLLRSLPSFAP